MFHSCSKKSNDASKHNGVELSFINSSFFYIVRLNLLLESQNALAYHDQCFIPEVKNPTMLQSMMGLNYFLLFDWFCWFLQWKTKFAA
jgi:hypothetical protein